LHKLCGWQTEHTVAALPEGMPLLHGVTSRGAGKGLREELVTLNRTLLVRFVALVHSLTLPPSQQPEKVRAQCTPSSATSSQSVSCLCLDCASDVLGVREARRG
jgi:hypothetical protein